MNDVEVRQLALQTAFNIYRALPFWKRWMTKRHADSVLNAAARIEAFVLFGTTAALDAPANPAR